MARNMASQDDQLALIAAAFDEAAKGKVKPPGHIKLTADERPFWDAIVSIKPSDEWTMADLNVVGQLAKIQCTLQVMHSQVRNEPATVKTVYGTEKTNPFHKNLAGIEQRQLQLMRALGIANATGRTITERRKQRTYDLAHRIEARKKPSLLG